MFNKYVAETLRRQFENACDQVVSLATRIPFLGIKPPVQKLIDRLRAANYVG